MSVSEFRLSSSHSSENIEDTAGANETKAWYYSLDLTQTDAVPAVFETAVKEARHPLRGLVACAGISDCCDATSYPIDVFRKILDVNITGTFLAATAAAKEMHRANVPGSIVLIASMSGFVSNKVLAGDGSICVELSAKDLLGNQHCSLQCFKVRCTPARPFFGR